MTSMTVNVTNVLEFATLVVVLVEVPVFPVPKFTLRWLSWLI